MYELSNEEIDDLLEQYDITRDVLGYFMYIFSNFSFIKSKDSYYELCEIACSRYQSEKFDIKYYTNIIYENYVNRPKEIYLSNIVLMSLKEVFDNPKNLNKTENLEFKKVKQSLGGSSRYR